MQDAAADALPLQAGHVVEERAPARALAEAGGFFPDAVVLDELDDFRPGDAIADMAVDIDDEIIVEAAFDGLLAAMRQDVVGIAALDDRRQLRGPRALHGLNLSVSECVARQATGAASS